MQMSLCVDRKVLAKDTKPIPLSLEVLDDSLGHPHTPGVV